MRCILFVIFVLFVYVDALFPNSESCGTWHEERLMKYIRRRNITDVITWSMSVIQYNNAVQLKEEDITSDKKISPYNELKNVLICPNMTMLYNMDRIMSIYMKLCKGLKNKRRAVRYGLSNIPPIVFNSKTTMNFIVQSEQVDTEQRKAVEYFVHTSSSLGIPSLSWFAGSVGNIEMEEKRLLLHLEPGAYHVAEAIVDFLKSYKWSVVTLVISKSLPGHEILIKELKRVRDERLEEEHEKHFNLDISKTLYIEYQQKSTPAKIKRKCIRGGFRKPGSPICPEGSYDYVLNQILKAEAKVVIFHGTKRDLYFLSFFYSKYNSTLFGKKYVWIITPAATKLKRMPGGQHSGQSAELESRATIPGMFGFAYDNSIKAYTKALDLAIEIFRYGLKEVAKIVKTQQANTSLSTILLPNFSCEDKSRSMYWDLGVTFYEKMKSITLKTEKERVGFLKNGYINTTKLFIMNTRVINNKTRWFKVGTWSMTDKMQQRSHLQIDGITFSGGANQPPSGMPRKVKMRVATLKERPFVVYSMPNKNNECDQNTIVCHVHPDSMNTTGLPQQTDFSASGNRTNQTKACCGGLTIDLLLEIKRDLNFDVELFEVEDVTWGIQTEKGWNGLVRVLLDGKADMVVTSFKITPNRSAAVDFSIPFQETGITIAVALREGKISHTAFLEPYDFSSWCVILIFSVHACGAALFVYEWLSPQGLDRGNVAPREDGIPDKDHRFSLFRSLWLIWSMLFSASVNADNPRGVASRVLASIWALFALVFLASYTANLAAFMIAKEEYYDLKGIKDIRLMSPWNQKPPFRFASVPSGATEENIRINFPRMAMYMRTYNKSSVTEGIKALKNGEIDAFIYDAYVLDYLEAHDENCKLKTVRNWFAMTGYGIAFPKKSKWLKKVNEKILDYQTNGKMQRWKKFWVSGNCKKSNQLGNTNKTLGVKNFISAFILLVGGMILCTVLLLLEHAFYRYMRPRIKSWDKYGCCGLVSISMGQLLSFEQSVNQTVDLIKHHKCKNPICETQLWKARHELEMARRKIRKLETAWNRNAIDTMPTSAAISYGEPTTSASISALPSALPDSTLGATGPCHSSTPDIDFHARSEPVLNEEPNPMCSCHLNNPPYPCDDATSEHSRLLPPALPARAINAQSDWRDAPPAHPHRHHNHYHPPMPTEPPGVQIRRPKSSGNIAVNHKYNPPQYEMIEKESVL